MEYKEKSFFKTGENENAFWDQVRNATWLLTPAGAPCHWTRGGDTSTLYIDFISEPICLSQHQKTIELFTVSNNKYFIIN